MESTRTILPVPRLRDFRAVLRVLEREVGSALQGQGECCGVTSAQCHVLLELEGAGCVNLTGLSARLELDKSTLSRTVDGLVQAGLVDRSADPENRRQQVICLSAVGKERVAGINGLCDAAYATVFNHIPVEKYDQVIESVGLLARALVRARKEEPQDGCSNGCCR